MSFIDNIIIDQMGLETTTHDCCIYRKVLMEMLSTYSDKSTTCVQLFVIRRPLRTYLTLYFEKNEI